MLYIQYSNSSHLLLFTIILLLNDKNQLGRGSYIQVKIMEIYGLGLQTFVLDSAVFLWGERRNKIMFVLFKNMGSDEKGHAVKTLGIVLMSGNPEY